MTKTKEENETTMEFGAIVGNNIKSYRQKFGYSQDHIAKYLEIDRTTLSKYESAEREISLLNLTRLADLFGIEIGDLIEKDSVNKEANLAFAFRSEGMEEQDIKSIASFQKVVKNYIMIVQISNEKK
ncbi:MAG: helix-turn-helix transcriptional regulator [Prolixibacteraceae bacterium]